MKNRAVTTIHRKLHSNRLILLENASSNGIQLHKQFFKKNIFGYHENRKKK
jgi:hypothetical protein